MTDDDHYILGGDEDFMRESMRRFIADELEKFKANKKTQDGFDELNTVSLAPNLDFQIVNS